MQPWQRPSFTLASTLWAMPKRICTPAVWWSALITTPVEVRHDPPARGASFGPDGLLPAIVQDVTDGTVLMLAYMNEEALEMTRRTGYTHFWSRSRQALWKKGETSGNVQRVVSMSYDCDGDALLVQVQQHNVACHTGQRLFLSRSAPAGGGPRFLRQTARSGNCPLKYSMRSIASSSPVVIPVLHVLRQKALSAWPGRHV